ncbi:alpha/beta hydrolase family protein [Haloferula chungangensis]|uniref:Alpha/beta hydrolase family protein n=1 Tax=Haloferula chungangensis TaxID=1048331 RepID=A0ABW2LA19_9BACT
MKSFLILIAFVLQFLPALADYDPKNPLGNVATELASFHYRDREVPLKIYLPEAKKAPVILLSHGLGGSREVGTYLGTYWAERGYVVVAMQHVGSDASVWNASAPSERMNKLKAAANGKTFLDRMKDVPATIDQLENWNADKNHCLFGKTDLSKIGMAGHSYGAVTTQALCGQNFGPLGPAYADPRIDAGLALSPSEPKQGGADQAFGKIKLPMMLMTGTKDGSPIGRTTPESRRLVYPALPAGSKYELVLKDAEHSAFSDARYQRGATRNPNHHVVITALSTAFWDAYLKEDASAKTWLESSAPEKLLEPGDEWQKK